jgi:hypothetical protein
MDPRSATIKLKWFISCLLMLGFGANRITSQTLYNGIVLPQPWPPVRTPTQLYQVPYYTTSPPAVIPIDVGRQLFVDDFLIQQTTLTRTSHQPVMYGGNPILSPSSSDTLNLAMPYSDGVWFDPADQTFKMWYYCGAGNMICYAYSADGVSWIKPSLSNAVVSGTNQVLRIGSQRNSDAVWMDLNDPNPAAKFKAFAYYPPGNMLVYFSPDGITWTPQTQYNILSLSDRTTLFYNPFRKVWVDSMRLRVTLPATQARASYFARARFYAESPDLVTWTPANFTSSFWTGPDDQDPAYNIAVGALPELYNLDAVPYESLMVGLFSWFYPKTPDIVELGVGFSRDGFYWVRPSRTNGPNAFIPASNTPGTWNLGNTQSSGGCFLVVGNELWFYFSGRNAQHSSTSAVGATGLATLRRDGFYSMDAGSTPGVLQTQIVQFSGKNLFVNVNDPLGSLQVSVLNPATGQPLATSTTLSADSTKQEVTWIGMNDLSSLAGQPVQFQFTLTNGELYSFWVTDSVMGSSNGYVAAGGPGFSGAVDVDPGAVSTVSTPVISPPGGTFTSPVTISLNTVTNGATIHYTTDGSVPDGSSTVYSAPFQLTTSATINALATETGFNNSGVSTASYIVNQPLPLTAAPSFSPAPGTYSNPQSITLTDATSGAVMYYTIDGSTPTTASTKYVNAINVASTITLKAIAVAPGFTNSLVVPATYTFNTINTISPAAWTLKFVDSQETTTGNGATKAFDETTSTLWHTQWVAANPTPPHEIQINLGASYVIGGFIYLPRQDGCSHGDIKQYEFYVSADGVNWGTPVSSGTFNYGANITYACPGGSVVGAILVSFPTVTASFVRLRALNEMGGNPWTSAAELKVINGGTQIATVSLTLAPSMLLAGGVSRGTVTLNAAAPTGGTQVTLVSSNSGAATVPASIIVPTGKTSATFSVSTALGASTALTITAAVGSASATAGLTLQSAIPRSAWTLEFADSQETGAGNYAATNAFDGKASTFWHTQWTPTSPPPPHEIQINLGAFYTMTGFTYLPRQDGCLNGTIKQYEFYVSADGVNWGAPVATGNFNYGSAILSCGGGTILGAQQVNFSAATGQYIRFRALSEVNGHPWTSAAEIRVLH